MFKAGRGLATPDVQQGCNGGKFIGTEVGVFKFDLSESEPESEAESESDAESEVVTREIFFT